MAKKFGKLVLFGIVAGAAAAGAYCYVQKKKCCADDFDELDKFDDNDPVVRSDEKRNYISLDSAKAFVTDTFEKAKDTITKVSRKFTTVSDAETDEAYDFAEEKEPAPAAVAADAQASQQPADAAPESEGPSEASIEEFFDDEEA